MVVHIGRPIRVAALDFTNYTVGVKEGDIVVFANGSGFLLVMVDAVHAGPEFGADRTELVIQYEVRSKTV